MDQSDAHGQRKNILNSMLHQNSTGFQMAYIPLHTLLVLWLFVQSTNPWNICVKLCIPVQLLHKHLSTHSHTKVKFKSKMALAIN